METPLSSSADSAPAPDEGRYHINSKAEMAFVLRSIAKSGTLVMASFGTGRDSMMTAILDVDADSGHVLLDSGADAELNSRLTRGQKLKVMSAQDGVKVEFAVEEITSVSFEGRLAFRIPFPDTMLKLQRREYYRLPTPVAQPLKCQIPLPGGGVASATLGDISLGGLSLMGEHPGLKLEPGELFDGCRVALPEVGTITAKLQVRNSFPVTLKNGTVTKRTGCMFVQLTPSQEAMIQRYIIRLERERRAKMADPKG